MLVRPTGIDTRIMVNSVDMIVGMIPRVFNLPLEPQNAIKNSREMDQNTTSMIIPAPRVAIVNTEYFELQYAGDRRLCEFF